MNRLKALFKWLTPPRDHDWTLVTYQPFFFTGMWVAAWVNLFFGDPFSYPLQPSVLPPVWYVVVLIASPMALASSRMIARGGKTKYIGFWHRLGADILMLTSLLAYLWARLSVGDYHIIPILGALIPSTIFALMLCIRDINTIRSNEKLADVIHRRRS